MGEISNYFLPKTRQERMVAKQQMDEQALTMSKRKDAVEVQNAYILPIYSTAKRAVNAPGGGGMQAITAGAGAAGQQQAIDDNRDRSMELTRKDIRGARDNSMRDLLRVEDKKE